MFDTIVTIFLKVFCAELMHLTLPSTHFSARKFRVKPRSLSHSRNLVIQWSKVRLLRSEGYSGCSRWPTHLFSWLDRNSCSVLLRGVYPEVPGLSTAQHRIAVTTVSSNSLGCQLGKMFLTLLHAEMRF
jgi:hypothetical protein